MITNIKQYWRCHKDVELYSIEIEKLDIKLIEMNHDRLDTIDEYQRHILSNKIRELTHDKARFEGKKMKLEKVMNDFCSVENRDRIFNNLSRI